MANAIDMALIELQGLEKYLLIRSCRHALTYYYCDHCGYHKKFSGKNEKCTKEKKHKWIRGINPNCFKCRFSRDDIAKVASDKMTSNDKQA